VVVTKKVGKAVVRNRVRRRLKAILDAPNSGLTPGGWYVIHCRPACATLKFDELRSQLMGALRRTEQKRKKRT
jgi:ribonuclease P protein component